jgi:hypothetical protein
MATSVSDLQIADDAKGLLTLLDNILETTVDIFESSRIPIPSKQFWTVGEAVYDYEQVSVTLSQVYLGRPGDEATEPRPCTDPRSAVVEIAVVRCLPTGVNGKAPSAEKIRQGAEFSAVDAYTLMDSLYQYDKWADQHRGLGVIATVSIPPPSGGMQAVVMTLTVAIP